MNKHEHVHLLNMIDKIHHQINRLGQMYCVQMLQMILSFFSVSYLTFCQNNILAEIILTISHVKILYCPFRKTKLLVEVSF